MLIQATQTWTMPVESKEWRPSERAVRVAFFSLALGMSLLLVSTPAIASAVAGQSNGDLTLLQGFEFLFFFAGIAIAPAMILVCASIARIGLRRVGWMNTDLLDDELGTDTLCVATKPVLVTTSSVPSPGFGEGKVNLPVNCKDQAA